MNLHSLSLELFSRHERIDESEVGKVIWLIKRRQQQGSFFVFKDSLDLGSSQIWNIPPLDLDLSISEHQKTHTAEQLLDLSFNYSVYIKYFNWQREVSKRCVFQKHLVDHFLVFGILLLL